MKNLSKALLFGSSVLFITSANASIGVGAKIAANYSNGKYSEKASKVMNNPQKFSGGKGKSHLDLSVFANKQVYEDDLLWIEGEVFLSAFGSRFKTDTNGKDRTKNSAGTIVHEDLVNDVSVRERFSAGLIANIGKELNDDYNVYGKFGITVSNFKINHYYDPDTTDTDPGASDNQTSYVIGGLAGVGLRKAVSDNVSLMIEANYHFTSSRKLNDFNAKYPATNTDLSERSVRLDKASLGFGFNINI